MQLDVVDYQDIQAGKAGALQQLTQALLKQGIVGIRSVPDYAEKAARFIDGARQLARLPAEILKQYAPDRDSGQTEGYELGAEWFKGPDGQWLIDDKKASWYAYVPDRAINIWPQELDFKSVYLDLGHLIFNVGKLVISALGLNETVGLNQETMTGYGRMLHYHKEGESTNANPNWCGAHFDHSMLTGLLPAWYYQDGQLVDEPQEAGLFIKPVSGGDFEKINAGDRSLLLFQVGEFGQLALHDQIKATKHLVKKARAGIERFTFALFFSPAGDFYTQSRSILTGDARYQAEQDEQGGIYFADWERASYATYRASQLERESQ